MRLALALSILFCSLSASGLEPLRVEVVLSDKQLNVYEGDDIVRSFKVAIGTLRHPTPEGEYLLRELIWNPKWVPLPPNQERKWTEGASAKEPGDADNPMRVLKIPFDAPYYYIHGTPDAGSIGTLSSHGCIRMTEEDVAALGDFLMQRAGEADRNAVARARRTNRTHHVRLPEPIPFTITMGKKNVYPGVIWDLD